MSKGISQFNYLLDLVYGSLRFQNGLLRPDVWVGNFSNTPEGQSQEKFSKVLLQNGFRRTPWQKVFPKQTAGYIKPIPELQEGINEAHVRFYSDGVISCELEPSRYSASHWEVPRVSGNALLEEILLNSEVLSGEEKNNLNNQITERDYSILCRRTKENSHYRDLSKSIEMLGNMSLLIYPLALMQYGPEILSLPGILIPSSVSYLLTHISKEK